MYLHTCTYAHVYMCTYVHVRVYIHMYRVMHRDLSSRNVLVHSLHAYSLMDVWVKVSDFGLACLADTLDPGFSVVQCGAV